MPRRGPQWGPEGVDGVRIASVELGDATRVDLSEQALAPVRAEAAAKLADPRVFLTARDDGPRSNPSASPRRLRPWSNLPSV